MVSSGTVRADRKWHSIAVRHLSMASELLRKGFDDGAFFHCYHAYECALSAVIANAGYPVPPDARRFTTASPRQSYYSAPKGPMSGNQSSHLAKLALFEQVAKRSTPYYQRHLILKTLVKPVARNDSLYYDSRLDRLPWNAFDHDEVLFIHNELMELVAEILDEIG